MDSETFVMYIASRKQEKVLMYFKRQVQIKAQSKAQVEALIFDEAPTVIPAEYFYYSNVFLMEYAVKLPDHTGINDHAIKLKKGKQPSFGPIYSLEPINLEILKTYIKTKLAYGFIRLSKSLAETFILFDRKPNKSFHLYMDYWDLSNLNIRN